MGDEGSKGWKLGKRREAWREILENVKSKICVPQYFKVIAYNANSAIALNYPL